MMVDITPPQETETYATLSNIDKAITMKDFVGFLERLLNDANAYLAEALKAAAENNEETDDYYVMVKYREGKSFSPDPELLLANFPDKYKQWKDAQLAKFKPKMTKTDFEALWTTTGTTREEKRASKEKNLAEMQSCMVEHLVNTQYALASVQAREEWKKTHPKED